MISPKWGTWRVYPLIPISTAHDTFSPGLLERCPKFGCVSLQIHCGHYFDRGHSEGTVPNDNSSSSLSAQFHPVLLSATSFPAHRIVLRVTPGGIRGEVGEGGKIKHSVGSLIKVSHVQDKVFYPLLYLSSPWSHC